MIERLFHLQANRTDVRTEVLGGATTFMTMVYIVFVNPQLLSAAGMDFGAVMTATCLSAGVATWVMGLAANYPIAMAPGMGENVFFLTVVTTLGISWQLALAAVFVSGVAFFVMNFFRLRELVIDAVPRSLKHAIAVGIGLFIAFMGFENAGLVTFGMGVPTPGDLGQPAAIVGLAGLVLTVVLIARGIRGAILLGILAATALAWGLDLVEWQGLVAAPPSLAPTFLQFDLRALLSVDVLPVVLIFLYMAVFDAIGTLIVLGSMLGTSTVTAYIESATGVEAGARTGLANMVTGALFLLALFFEPLVSMVGGGVVVGEEGAVLHPMTAPAVIVVGSLMARNVARVDWKDFTEAFPAFLVVVGIPFAWSIADGIALGFIAYPLLKLVTGRFREASWLVYVLGVLFALRYVFL
jgi:AGZA family xanthine/uracil permease-like MFS transporter